MSCNQILLLLMEKCENVALLFAKGYQPVLGSLHSTVWLITATDHSGAATDCSGPYVKKLNPISVCCCLVLIRSGQLSSVVVRCGCLFDSSSSSSSSMNIRKQAKRPLFLSEVDNIYTNINKTKLILFSHRLSVLDVGFIVIIQTKTTPNRIKTSLKTINTACWHNIIR